MTPPSWHLKRTFKATSQNIKMKISQVLAAARVPAKEPVPFQERLPLRLKDKVSGKGDNLSEVCCLYEMSLLFACFKRNEFNQALCSKEIESFQKCYRETTARKLERKEKEAKGILTPGEKKMSAKQINQLLRKFPNVSRK